MSVCHQNLEKNTQAPTWLLQADYKPIDDVMLYAKYARGYRTGGVYPTAPQDLLTYEPEKVDTFEIGAKTAWNGNVPGSFNFAAFYNNFRNQQLQLGSNSDVGLPPTAGIINAGKSRIYGLEADLHVGPVAGLALDVNYAYLNTKIQEVTGIENGQCLTTSNPGTCNAGAVDYYAIVSMGVGSPLLLSPKHKVAVTGSYTLPLSESIGKVTLAATYTWQSSQLSNYSSGAVQCFVDSKDFATFFTSGGGVNCSDNAGKLPAYGLLNLNVNWNSVGGKPLDLAFFVTNLTKKQYYVYSAGTLGYGFETATIGTPRMFGVSAKVHF
jgi:iron complex outermembrane receptor protein